MSPACFTVLWPEVGPEGTMKHMAGRKRRSAVRHRWRAERRSQVRGRDDPLCLVATAAPTAGPRWQRRRSRYLPTVGTHARGGTRSPRVDGLYLTSTGPRSSVCPARRRTRGWGWLAQAAPIPRPATVGDSEMAPSTHDSTRVTSVTFRGSERRRGAAIRPPLNLAGDTTAVVRH
jgi:hypothetical protein